MKKYAIEIRTVFYKIVEVEAENLDQAKDKAMELVDSGDIDACDTVEFETDISSSFEIE